MAFGASFATLALAATAVFASVSFDSSTGTGFVGKGDVQAVLGLNNAQMQAQAKDLVFSYKTLNTYDVTCEWETVTGGPKSQTIFHDITVPKHIMVKGSVEYEARQKKQITGFNLNGFGNVVANGTVPEVGDDCPGNSNQGLITEVTETGSTGGLYVNGELLQ